MITTGHKEYSDSYLMSLTKKDIIKQLRCAEHNFMTTEQMLEQHMENVKDWQPIVHAHWEWCEEIQPIDLNGMISTYTWSGWKCSHCKESIEDITDAWSKIDSSPQVDYCPRCGAKMDEEEE